MTEAKGVTNLETSLQTINQIISQMEQGDLTLDQSLECFAQGISLIKECQTILRTAEHKVQILLQNSEVLTDMAPLKSTDESCSGG